jgi:hypothetical protein
MIVGWTEDILKEVKRENRAGVNDPLVAVSTTRRITTAVDDKNFTLPIHSETLRHSAIAEM